MNEPVTFDMVRRPPSPRLCGLVTDICAYRETSAGRFRQREAASLVVPFIVSLGSPFRIALGREPDAGDRQPSFVAGLFPGAVHIELDGAAECVQVNLTPLGAYRLLGGAVTALTARMVDIEDIAGRDAAGLRQRLADTTTLPDRIDLVEEFVARRIAFAPSREITFAYGALSRSRGTMPISRLAGEIGWSRKHFGRRFAAEIGLAPKMVARIMRFQNACRLSSRDLPGGWAEIAAEAGYADQAHLVREFSDLADEPPGAWARRMALTDERLALT